LLIAFYVLKALGGVKRKDFREATLATSECPSLFEEGLVFPKPFLDAFRNETITL
jgi:hypothetical protein